MIAGLRGSLLSHDALADAIAGALREFADPGGAAAARRRILGIHEAAVAQLGPASGPRLVFDLVAAPLAAALGFRLTATGQAGAGIRGVLEAGGAPVAALVATGWGRDAAGAWREAVHHGIGTGVRWCFCVTGPIVAVVDARRTYTRRFAEFEIGTATADESAFAIFWCLLRAAAFAQPDRTAVLDRAVQISEDYRAGVRASLQLGVRAALEHLLGAFAAAAHRRPGAHTREALFEESLVVVYRVLFLLFAEARGLVPRWHPTYRESYTIESLRPSIELGRSRGLWESLQAIARLAHRGCRAGPLRVPPFNGRLFSPAHAPLADTRALDDDAVRLALLALTTRTGVDGRRRISFADLGVEQLGGVYERILDYAPGVIGDPETVAAPGRQPLPVLRGGRSPGRKATGSFYTPRALTEFVVRRTLAPLVETAAPEDILSVRVLDPAMGSGAFLVAACRYLAGAYEAALVREGAVSAADVDADERADFRRVIAQRCLFGVDLNPMAVQLGRLSLWLATLARDKPLTFLDHHLRTGNSIAGASVDDLARQPPYSGRRRVRTGGLPLLELTDADSVMSGAVAPRLSLAREPGDTLEQVRGKERLLASLGDPDAALAHWKAVADLWCAAWFRGSATPAASAATFGALADLLLGREPALPPRIAQPLLDEARRVAARERFFHWPLEFPEVFRDSSGRELERAGFDAIVGNPPWEMLRGDQGDADAREAAARGGSALTTFTRGSGIYTLQGDGQANMYQLFVERSLALLRDGGRLGLILPSGFATDHGAAALRRGVFDRCGIDTLVSVENRDGLFPIHRGLRFLLLSGTAGVRTEALPYRAGVRSPAVLDALPDAGPDPAAVILPRPLLARMTGEQCAVPEIRDGQDLAIAARIAFGVPALGDPEGWHVRFGRELNATDDRRHFVSRDRRRGRCLPVIEGKHIQPFVAEAGRAPMFIPEAAAERLLDATRTYARPRLAYRDVASATNRLTLIAAVVPRRVVTTHTLFCLKDALDEDAQLYLCGIFNSFVANYLVRLRVSTHVTVAIVDRLPVPRPPRESAAFNEVVSLAASLTLNPLDEGRAARLQSRVARLYGLSGAEFAHVLSTFPLVDGGFRTAVMECFNEAAGAGGLVGKGVMP